MNDLEVGQTDHEAKVFEEVKANLMRQHNYVRVRWEEIRNRYVYQGRQYNAQEVTDWFMNAPFQEVAAISKELGIEWKTIGNDVQWMADPLKVFAQNQAILSDTKGPVLGDAGIYAMPRVIENIEQCYFYHTIDLPGHGTIEGDWDLRRGIDDYLGGVDYNGKRVLDVGTANGMICFETERRGADVTAFDLSKEYSWDLIPYARWEGYEDIRHGHRHHIDMLNNAYWFCHRALHSNAKAVYGDVYHIPEQIGKVDIVIYGSILLHLRDPFLALQRGTRLAQEAVVVTEVHRDHAVKSEEPHMRFLPDPGALEPKDTWWDLRPEFIVRAIKVLGFEDVRVTYHTQPCRGEKVHLYTVVGRRTN